MVSWTWRRRVIVKKLQKGLLHSCWTQKIRESLYLRLDQKEAAQLKPTTKAIQSMFQLGYSVVKGGFDILDIHFSFI